jgi:hypothetical protein
VPLSSIAPQVTAIGPGRRACIVESVAEERGAADRTGRRTVAVGQGTVLRAHRARRDSSSYRPG